MELEGHDPSCAAQLPSGSLPQLDQIEPRMRWYVQTTGFEPATTGDRGSTIWSYACCGVVYVDTTTR